MPTFQTKKCPHCGKVYERNSYGGHPSKDNRTQYGSPLKFCASCKKGFMDDEYREIAIDGPREADTMRISPAGIVYSLILLLAGICGFVSDMPVIGFFLIAVALYMSLSELLTYDKRQKKLQAEAAASEARLRNPAYAMLLKQYGYDVPEKYLVTDVQYNADNH